jgi:hypothetical protein
VSIPTDNKTFPFTKSHLNRFRREINAAGSFDALMFKKQALKRQNGLKYIVLNYDSDGYKKKFLNGVYKSLRPMYDTDMPLIFWNGLYEVLSVNNRRNK